MGLFRRKREPFLTASPDAPVPGMAATTSVAPAEAPAATGSAPEDDAPVVEPFTLAVEDVFSITGRGTVATGTVATGTVRRDETVEIVRDGVVVATTAVTGIETLRRQVDSASAGASVGLLLKGVARDQIARDDLVRAAP
ncbi:EF-Tu/IF-2/RF-3 family GTPase [Luteimicrobium sp. DT211]|uniref:EF-Tu/IF-2/RF-3 family GTPase n=1 Tax=Luteimicrobium sp. DT211 TaxID=3393412 RepID=UPI003CF7D54E